MTADLVQDSWDRIDDWLRRHAPRTFASLAPPATAEEIRGAEQELDLTFPPDLVASLRRHNGAQGEGAFDFPTHDRLLSVQEIVDATGFLRGIAEDLDEEEDEEEEEGDGYHYWHHGFLQFGSYEVTADGLTIDSRPGRSYGAIGRFFDETGTDFGRADSLGDYLAEVADWLERSPASTGDGDSPVTFNGRLIWAWAYDSRPDWGSADDPLPPAVTGLPGLNLPESPSEPLRTGYLHGLEELGALIATLPRERIAVAAWKQMRRLATESGLATYTEVAAALDAAEQGAEVGLSQDGPLGLRLRAVIAEATERGDDARKWAAESMVVALCGSPHRAAADIAGTRSRLSLDWRDELLADLGSPPVPSAPDDMFWAMLNNPDIDTSYYAAQLRGSEG